MAGADLLTKHTDYVAKTPDAQGYIDYSSEEDSVWADLYAQQQPAVQRYAASQYLSGLARLSLPQRRIPQCAEVSAVLHKTTGWRVEPVPALINFQRFYAMLAERVFPAASFIRRREAFDYIEEPDIFHEIFGHTPLLTDQRFADFSQTIGLTGLRANSNDYSWLARLYWFTIEFGLIKDNNKQMPLGAGLVSSPSELRYAASSETAIRRPFDVLEVLRTPYRIDIHQPIYYVLDSLDQLFDLVDRDLLADIKRAQRLGLREPLYPVKAG